MSIQLTEQQQQALDTHAENPPRVIDPRSNAAYYLIAARDRYECVVSDETVRELEETGYPEEKREKCLELVIYRQFGDFTCHCKSGQSRDIEERLMPADDRGDAFHLALATWYRIQYLLTWNCKHLANANKFEHVQVLNARRRFVSPALVTPAQPLEIEP